MVNDQAVDINTELDIVTWTTFMILLHPFLRLKALLIHYKTARSMSTFVLHRISWTALEKNDGG